MSPWELGEEHDDQHAVDFSVPRLAAPPPKRRQHAQTEVMKDGGDQALASFRLHGPCLRHGPTSVRSSRRPEVGALQARRLRGTGCVHAPCQDW